MWRIFRFKIQQLWVEGGEIKTSCAGVGSYKHSVCGSKATQIPQHLSETHCLVCCCPHDAPHPQCDNCSCQAAAASCLDCGCNRSCLWRDV